MEANEWSAGTRSKSMSEENAESSARLHRYCSLRLLSSDELSDERRAALAFVQSARNKERFPHRVRDAEAVVRTIDAMNN